MNLQATTSSTTAESAVLAAAEETGELWFISDVHGNGAALRAALETIPPEAPLVFLGDMLTYGCQVSETIMLLEKELDVRAMLLILGNHEQLYLDLQAGDSRSYEALPGWIRESVDWTASHADDRWRSWPWQERGQLGEIQLHHANTAGYGDWRYVDTAEAFAGALDSLREESRLVALGHTHRARVLVRDSDRERSTPGREHWLTDPLASGPVQCGPGQELGFNPGSVGQPRNRTGKGSLAELGLEDDIWTLRHHPVTFDQSEYRESVQGAGLSAECTERLLGFYPSAASSSGR